MTAKKRMGKVLSIGDLNHRAQTDERYHRLAMMSAQNLGGTPKDLQEAIKWLNINADETDSETGVVKEINFCLK